MDTKSTSESAVEFHANASWFLFWDWGYTLEICWHWRLVPVLICVVSPCRSCSSPDLLGQGHLVYSSEGTQSCIAHSRNFFPGKSQPGAIQLQSGHSYQAIPSQQWWRHWFELWIFSVRQQQFSYFLLKTQHLPSSLSPWPTGQPSVLVWSSWKLPWLWQVSRALAPAEVAQGCLPSFCHKQHHVLLH